MDIERIRRAAKDSLPPGLRRIAGSARRTLAFERAMRRFRADPDGCARVGHPVLRDLIEGWGNDWSAQEEYLVACLRRVSDTSGPVLECGSGLSTLLLGVVAQRRRIDYWALENSPEWAARIRRLLRRHRLDRVVLHEAPLRSYGEFTWYDPPLMRMPDAFRLVICDGPPGATPGGRYGLVPVMTDRLARGAVVLLDDGAREAERAIAARWAEELGARWQLHGVAKPYIEMTLPGAS